MITRIEIDGFKSFVGFSLDLAPFTVLAGPNNSGKSNLLEAVELLRDQYVGRSRGLLAARRRGTGIELFHRTDNGVPSESLTILAKVRAPFPEGRGSLPLRMGSAAEEGRVVSVYWQNPHAIGESSEVTNFEDRSRLDEWLASWVLINPDPAAMRHGASLDDSGPLAGSGANLAAVIGRIFEGERAEDFVLDAQFVISDLVAIEPVRDTRRNQWDFDLTMRGGRVFTPALVSDGTLRILALLAALHDPDHEGVVMIEDVENGLHPEYQGRLCDRLAARTAHSDRQIIATTHSPVVVAATLEQSNSTVVFLDQVAGPAEERDGVRRAQHRTRARHIATGGERGTYVTQAELDTYLTVASGR